VKTFLRYLIDQRGLWRLWLPLMILAGALPLLAAATPLLQRYIIDDIVLAGQPAALLPAVGLYGFLWLLHLVVNIGASTLGAHLSERSTLELRQKSLAHWSRLAIPFARRGHSGQTLALLTGDVPVLGGLSVTVLRSGFGSLAGIVVAAGAMLNLNPQLAVAAAVAPPIAALLAAVATRPLRPAARRAQEKAAELGERLQESLAGLREIVAFGLASQQGARVGQTLTELMRLRLRLNLLDTGMRSGQSVFSLVVSVVILGYGSFLVMRGETTIGTLVAMQSLFGLLFQPAAHIFGVATEVQRALGSADRVYAFLDEPVQVEERPGARLPRAVAGAVTFDGVSFAYGADQPVLRDVSLSVRPGETVAIVGPSGAGKTSLVSLIMRFYDPQQGRVLLDGVDVRELTLEGLRRQVGIVFQDTFLFAASMRENIAFGREGATETEIVAAARAANAWEFIERLPEGLDTPVGERGVRLSEGQKQRLAIARALVRDPRILILDEPTSALDAQSEARVQAALETARRGRTTFVVAHRLATVRSADRILVVERGRVVQEGTHAALVVRPGLYRDLCALQFTGAPSTGDPQPSGDDGAAAAVDVGPAPGRTGVSYEVASV
jgi:ABC-type multidrug transport system fused ATPase/permease subunit